MANIKQYFAQLACYSRMDAMWFLRDTRIVLFAILSEWISHIASISGMFLLAWQFNGIGEMSRYEVLFMLGFVSLVSGINDMCFSFNISHISRRIGRGQLEHMMMQPVPIWMQLLTEGFIPFSGNGSLLTGIIIIAVAVAQIGLHVTFGWVLHLVLQLFSSVFLLLGLSYLFSTAAFYAPVAAEEIASDVYGMSHQLSRYPLSGMPKPVQGLLCSLLPSGLVGWFPACALVGKTPLGLPAQFPLYMALAVWTITAILFRKGWNYYVKTGINRYSALGHRS